MRWVAILLGVAPSLVQAQALPEGWSLREAVLPGGIEELACGADTGAVRSWDGALATWDGETWSTAPHDGTTRYGRALAVATEGHVFLESGAGIAEWTGTRWVHHLLLSWEGDLGGQIAAVSPTEVYTVGRGRIAHFDGRFFRTYGAGTWRGLSAIAAPGEVLFVGGQGGTILRHDGTDWARQETGIDTHVHRLVAFGPTDVWAWADGASWRESVVLHFDGRRWERRDPALGSAVRGIGGAADRTYIAGDFGLARWVDGAWRVELSPADFGAGGMPHGVCATDRHHLVVRGRDVFVRPRS